MSGNIPKINNQADIPIHLINKAKQFDDEAVNQIFDYFKPFLKNLAFKYFLVGSDKDDVIQEGMIGLFLAIKNYDDTKNKEFVKFAKSCIILKIKTAIKNSLRQKHIPLNNSISYETSLEKHEKYAQSPETEIIDVESYEQINTKLRKILSKFELTVLYLLNSGLTYKETASVLGRSTKSVDNALQRIKKKAAPLFDFN